MVFAALALLVSSPLVVLAGVLIKLEDGGPAIHRRQVVGVGGREFRAFKLRTMRVDADAWLASHPEALELFKVETKLVGDPRVTRIGRVLRRFHIDELPQFANVLVGQMSLVGPRMIHPSEIVRFGTFASRRLSVKPGLTGLWQVTPHRTNSYAERIDCDRQYLEQRSLTLDLQILIRTVPTALLGTTPR